MDTCFFIGHRNAPQALQPRLAQAVEHCICALGITRFVVGHYGAFDAMAAAAVRQARIAHPEIDLYLLLPYHPGERPVSLPEGFDGSLYPFEVPVPRRLAILKANQAMIDSCRCLIAYAAYPGNARNLLEYAQKRREPLPICNLAQDEPIPASLHSGNSGVS